jgi:hypothetical protein
VGEGPTQGGCWLNLVAYEKVVKVTANVAAILNFFPPIPPGTVVDGNHLYTIGLLL